MDCRVCKISARGGARGGVCGRVRVGVDVLWIRACSAPCLQLKNATNPNTR